MEQPQSQQVDELLEQWLWGFGWLEQWLWDLLWVEQWDSYWEGVSVVGAMVVEV